MLQDYCVVSLTIIHRVRQTLYFTSPSHYPFPSFCCPFTLSNCTFPYFLRESHPSMLRAIFHIWVYYLFSIVMYKYTVSIKAKYSHAMISFEAVNLQLDTIVSTCSIPTNQTVYGFGDAKILSTKIC